jgi:hypothetical protein
MSSAVVPPVIGSTNNTKYGMPKDKADYSYLLEKTIPSEKA